MESKRHGKAHAFYFFVKIAIQKPAANAAGFRKILEFITEQVGTAPVIGKMMGKGGLCSFLADSCYGFPRYTYIICAQPSKINLLFVKYALSHTFNTVE